MFEFEFQWGIAESGYDWEDDVLCPMKWWTEVRSKPYKPLVEHTGLFLILAHTVPTREHIRAFANTYGLLWHGPDEASTWDLARLPHFTDWAKEIGRLHLAVTLREFARTQNDAGLTQYVDWRETSGDPLHEDYRPEGWWIDTNPDCSYVDRPKKGAFDAYIRACHHLHDGEGQVPPRLHVRKWLNPEQYGEQYSQTDTANRLKAALAYVGAAVNARLEKPRMRGPSPTNQFSLVFEPPSLLTALWLQFASALTGNKAYHQCPVCQTWFELSPAVNRADRLFCSNACRTRAYRQRITSAQRLHAQGMELEIIAQQLDTNVKTVRRWLAKRYPVAGTVRRGRKPKLPYPASQ